MPLRQEQQRAFTLVELSIVLVVIGLIVGGVLVGKDLIRNAEFRATISDVEDYRTAVSTFRGKYNALPGDIPQSAATAFGLTPSGVSCGSNNKLIDDYFCNTPAPYMVSGEASAFWVNLSEAKLIKGSYILTSPSSGGLQAGTHIPMPKVGRSMLAYHDGQGQNWFVIGPDTVAAGTPYSYSVSGALMPSEAWTLDKKMDDGMPNSGAVRAGSLGGGGINLASPIAAVSVFCSSDGSNANTAAAVYQMAQSGPRCTLRFQFP